MPTPSQQDQEYALWMIKDTASELGQAVAIYAAALGAYWYFVG
jgi:hypothetical protein